MQIVIACGAMSFGPHTLEHGSLGGSETAALSLGKALAKRGHEVTMFCNLPKNGPDAFASGTLAPDGVRYVDLSQYQTFVCNVPLDLLIVVRDPNLIAMPILARKKVLWMHDIATYTTMAQALDQMSWTFDEIWSVSEWHRQQIHKVTGYPLNKIVAFRNGISKTETIPPTLNTRNKKQILYAARPERGLSNLVDVGGIMERLPDYTLYVCMYAYAPDHMKDYYDHLMYRMKQLPNVKFIGPQRNGDLRALMAECEAYIYPTQFEETSCIIARECIEQGTPFLTTRTGALPETLDNCGIYFEDWVSSVGAVEPEKGSPEWCAMFAAFFRASLGNAPLVLSVQKAMASRTDLYWDGVAEKVEQHAYPIRSRIASLAWSLIQDSDIFAAKAVLDNAGSTPMTDELRKEIVDCYPFILPKDHPNHVSMGDYYSSHYNDSDGGNTIWQDELIGDRLNAIAKHIESLPPGARILEYGCGCGNVLAPLAKKFPDKDFVGIDISDVAVNFVNRHIESLGIKNMKVYLGDFDTSPDIPTGFDAVIATEVLEHVIEPWKALERVESCAKPGGQIILTVPFGAWDPQTFHVIGQWKQRSHIWDIDMKMIREMLGPRKQERVAMMVLGRTPDHRPMGNLLFAFAAQPGTPLNAIDPLKKSERHIPRQTAAAVVIAMDNEDTILRLLNSLDLKVQFVSIALGPCKDDTEGVITRWFEKRPWMRYRIVHVPRIEAGKFGFDDARNASADGLGEDFDWILWIDTDEYLSGDFAPYLRNNAYDGYMIAQHHFTCEPRGAPAEIDRPARLCRTDAGYRARGHIHEHFEVPAGGPGHCYFLPKVDIGHTGYVDEEVRKKKFFRNFPLLEWDNDHPETQRPIHKFLWFRDIVHRMRFAGENRDKQEWLRLAKEGKAYYDAHWQEMSNFGPGLVQGLRYLGEINGALGLGFPLEVSLRIPGADGQPKVVQIGSVFDSYEQIERIMKHLLDPEFQTRLSGYW